MRAGKPVDEVGIVVHEDLLLHLAGEPVAGAAVGGDDHAEPHREALLVGPVLVGRVDRRAGRRRRAARPRSLARSSVRQRARQR